MRRLLIVLRIQEFHVEAQTPDLLHEHVERFRHAGLEIVLALDDALVDLGAARHVVGLDREHLLQGIGGAVGFQRPDLHLAEALAAELRLAAQRLLGDEAVGPGGARVDLVVDKVVQLEHVLDAHRHRARELLAGAPVEERRLPALVKARAPQRIVDIGFLRAVEDRGGDRHAVA